VKRRRQMRTLIYPCLDPIAVTTAACPGLFHIQLVAAYTAQLMNEGAQTASRLLKDSVPSI
jgi:hypothetical protein